jgi:hypothetical protein
MAESDFQNSFKDKTLQCVDCGTNFCFSAGEQAFFASKRPPLSPPKRCPNCRAFRKRTINPGISQSDTVEYANVSYDTAHNGDHKGGRQ